MFRRNAQVRPPDLEYPGLSEGLVVYAVGDVHGRSDLLADLHEAIDAEPRPPGTLEIEVYLGDYVDRGPDSRGVVDLLIERAARRRLVLLRGNHEIFFERFLAGGLSPHAWCRFGGEATLLSYGIDPADLAGAAAEEWIAAARRRIPPSHVAFLNALTRSFSVEGYFFAHAGIRPGTPLEDQSVDDLCWIRSEFLSDERDFGAVVVHGHTPTILPEFRHNRIDVDTGAYATDCLTCLVIDGTGPGALLQSFTGAPTLASVRHR